ncbi:cyanamide hydratase [Plenodomus tracheiphilus IPT5]|uniref:Cyanamide hydratase n=1 Tax=Plenodomus tracheiphilus IPT5 TaxID=1408161 RepID=A0A6A7BNA3_9PLEO|nr:cyanamide hydratase [Plenodomus tracheiphilus IPT5]
MPYGNENSELWTNGWTAVPRSFRKSLAGVDQEEQARLAVQDVKLPDSDIAKKTYAFAKAQLPEQTFNHSMRVVYYGYAIVSTHFPHLKPLLETYYLTCLLHDLGTTTENLHGTHMSFEYYGSFQAMNFLRENGATKDQAEAVGEAIIRHADLGETGTLTSLGMLIQLSTVFGKLVFLFPLVGGVGYCTARVLRTQACASNGLALNPGLHCTSAN